MSDMDWLFWPFTDEEDEYDPYGQLNPEQKAMMQKLGPFLTNAATNPAEQYSGKYTADLTSGEQALINQNSRLNAMAEKGFSNLLSGEFPEEYYQNSIYKPMLKQLQEQEVPAVAEEYAGIPGGYWGNARADAISKKYQDFNDVMASKRAELGYKARQGVSEAASNYANYLKSSEEVQQIPRLISQYGLDKQYTEWVRTRPESLPYINWALKYLGLDSATKTEGKSAEQQIMDLLSVAGDAAALAMMFV